MWPRPPAEPVEGRGVYVMRTLRDLRHMGRVLWVTFQEPWSQERVGGGIGGVGEGVLEGVGWRREMGGGEVVVAMVGGLVVVVVVGVVGRVRCGGLGMWCCALRWERGRRWSGGRGSLRREL